MIPLTQLLAPTWEERKQADEALLAFTMENQNKVGKHIQQQLQAMDDPKAFVHNVIAFWGSVIFKDYKYRMGKYCQQEAWEITFDYDNSKAFADINMHKIRANLLRGVPTFIEHLGFMGEEVEEALLCCLAHPEPVVVTVAEKAIGDSQSLSDSGFQTMWAEMSASRSDWWQRRKDLAQHLTISRLETLFTAILADKSRGKKATAPASLALGALGELSGVCAKIAYDFLEEHLPTKRKAEAQASFIHALTKLSKQFGFSTQSTAYCREHFIAGHHYERHDNDRLYAAYVNYLSSQDVPKNIDILQQVKTPWALSTLCRNLQTADEVPVAVLQHAVGKSLGNYDGCDGMPHDDAVELLLSQHKYIVQCRHLIFAWWNTLCHESSVKNYWEHEELDDAIAFIKVLKDKAQPMLEGLQQALDYFIYDDMDNYDFASIQKKFAEHMRILGYSEIQIKKRLSTQEQLLDTFKALLNSDYGDLFKPISEEEFPDCDEDEAYEELYELDPMIEKLSLAIRMIEERLSK